MLTTLADHNLDLFPKENVRDPNAPAMLAIWVLTQADPDRLADRAPEFDEVVLGIEVHSSRWSALEAIRQIEQEDIGDAYDYETPSDEQRQQDAERLNALIEGITEETGVSDPDLSCSGSQYRLEQQPIVGSL